MSFSLQNKQVIVLGLGLTGRSCVAFAKQQGARVIAMDTRTHLTVDVDVEVKLGAFDSTRLCEADLILLSPGISLHDDALQPALAAGVEVIGDIELFARYNRRPVIAITGSNGKSTVTSLCTAILQRQGYQVLMGGNIGTPALALLEQAGDIVVLELSSFQLETLSSLQPLAATVLNVTEDHIDRHGNIQAYAEAKQRIYRQAQHCVYNADDRLTLPVNPPSAMAISLQHNPQGFTASADGKQVLLCQKPVLTLNDSALVGLHNNLNLQAAAALVAPLDVAFATIQQAANDFQPLPHRCQWVARIAEVDWVNDSKATNVGATLAAITGLAPTIGGKLILILGGDSKGADVAPLKPALQQTVKKVITLGKDAQLFETISEDFIRVNSMHGAVHAAAKEAQAGDMVLLSPACASLDMFDNFAQRGEQFSQAVRELAA